MHGIADAAILAAMRILIADDHPLFRRALALAVREHLPQAQVDEAATLSELQARLTAGSDIDLILLDLHLPDSQGLMGLAALRAEHPAIAVVMVSAHEDARTIRRALACGASGYIPKSSAPEQLGLALRTVVAGHRYLPEPAADPPRDDPDEIETLARRLTGLTPQQHRVLAEVAQGRLNKQIADHLGIQERTVKAHLTAIFERLGVRNRTQAGIALRSLALADPAAQPPP